MASGNEEEKKEQSTSKTRILIAVSHSSIKGYPHASISSDTAFHWVLDKLVKPTSSSIGHRREDFELSILHIQVPDEDGPDDDLDSVYESASDFHSMKERELTRGLHLLEHFVRICDDAKIPCKAWIKAGDPKELICKEAAKLQPDMLVLGSRGLKTMQRMFVGTVSLYCTTHATCPVLVIKRKPQDTPDDPMDD
ncbi:hypothetical protein SELMODRAFT_173688 [Selaginella moellendorffii]|uniref:UspA domain-containing protein n=1 Tax=Selaginella moellendorffii TaxID=88036 RepID=D8RRZ9_SELML|nr:universal stress protein A-like protein [Selaginella moellendorffii]XP_002983562.1 universal stress protein A-like protein [Selaginella moellendorffii]EFJ15463.1 hypothetical protein SELMODRAFT_180247 [Selaginella moellendorffii]EFJ24783.1 hypothetical protein SELMODRAFT_173688 [Selaginella moellendorffii]|eukprot:XP_002973828.1 universal stress protein A-like protein [Selaginella moellendorffii]